MLLVKTSNKTRLQTPDSHVFTNTGQNPTLQLSGHVQIKSPTAADSEDVPEEPRKRPTFRQAVELELDEGRRADVDRDEIWVNDITASTNDRNP